MKTFDIAFCLCALVMMCFHMQALFANPSKIPFSTCFLAGGGMGFFVVHIYNVWRSLGDTEESE